MTQLQNLGHEISQKITTQKKRTIINFPHFSGIKLEKWNLVNSKVTPNIPELYPDLGRPSSQVLYCKISNAIFCLSITVHLEWQGDAWSCKAQKGNKFDGTKTLRTKISLCWNRCMFLKSKISFLCRYLRYFLEHCAPTVKTGLKPLHTVSFNTEKVPSGFVALFGN